MTRLSGPTANEIRDLQPDARRAWDEIEANVLRSGVADGHLKELCFRFLASEVSDLVPFRGRERLALEWAHAIAFDSDEAGGRVGGKLAVPNSPSLDHALLPVGDRDERAELDDLRVGQVLAES